METRHSNLLELQAAYLALLAFENLIQGARVKLMLDNQTAVAYITKQGGTKSLLLLLLATDIFVWAKAHVEALTAAYIRGSQNWTKVGTQQGLSENNLLQVGYTLDRSDGNPMECRGTPVCVHAIAILPFWPQRPWFPNIAQVLEFLQSALSMGLAYNTIKV